MTYKVFGGTLSLTKSINQSTVAMVAWMPLVWPLAFNTAHSNCYRELFCTGLTLPNTASCVVCREDVRWTREAGHWHRDPITGICESNLSARRWWNWVCVPEISRSFLTRWADVLYRADASYIKMSLLTLLIKLCARGVQTLHAAASCNSDGEISWSNVART